MTEAIYIAVIVNFFTTAGLGIKAYLEYRAKKNGENNADKLVRDAIKKQMGFNPHPPGESMTCRDNRDRIIKNGNAIENLEKRLDRIEGKLNGTYGK